MLTFDTLSLEILKFQLQLTTYEAIALIAIIHGIEQPGSIASFALGDTKIPRPKVYGALSSLESKGLILRTKDDGFQPDISRLESLKRELPNITRNYIEFIEGLFELAVDRKKTFRSIETEIQQFLKRSGYKVEVKKISYPIHLPHYASTRYYAMRDEYVKRRAEIAARLAVDNSSKEKRMLSEMMKDIDQRIQTLNREVHWSGKESSESQDISLIITQSPNSGINIGIVLDKEGLSRRDLSFALYDYCTAALIITSHNEEESQSVTRVARLGNVKFAFTSIRGDYINAIKAFLEDLDIQWSKLRDKLSELESSYDKDKDQTRRLMYQVKRMFEDGSFYSRPLKNNPFKEVFENILSRIKNDLEVNDDLLSELGEIIHNHFAMLGGKELFPLDDLSDIEKRLEIAHRRLEDKERELGDLVREIYLIGTERNQYVKYGLKLNPFSLTVPLEAPDEMVNQDKPKAIANEFINGVIKGSDSNLMLIVGEQGVGKTHFLNYFANKINTEKFGRSIAVRIQCKSNKDILDLYPQIADDIKTVLLKANQNELAALISRILTDAGSPRFVSDLMKVLSDIQSLLTSKNYQGMFICIDEFENSLPAIHEHKEHPGRLSRTRIGTPGSVLQLDALTNISGMGFIITFRKEDYDRWKNEINKKVTKIDNKNIINLDVLSYEDTVALIRRRLGDDVFSTPTPSMLSRPVFEDNAIKLIHERSKGNARLMLRLSSAVFRRAATDELKIIDAKMIESIIRYI